MKAMRFIGDVVYVLCVFYFPKYFEWHFERELRKLEKLQLEVIRVK